MLRSLLTRFGFGSTLSSPERRRQKTRTVEQFAKEEAPADPIRPVTLPPEAIRFLQSLVTTPSTQGLQSFPPDDRLFLSEIMKRLRENTLEVPVLPGTAIEISRLLADPKSNLGDFVRAIESDPALSVSVLRTANSAFYGLTVPTTSLRDAVFRIGLTQLRTIVILSHLQDKVLRTGLFEDEVQWLSDLSLSLAHLAQALATDLELDRSVAFTRGTLWHLEHFLIMGTLAEVARQHRVEIHPSEQCLHEAFFRFGRKIRELAARIWELEDLLICPGEEDETTARFEHLQRSLIASTTGGPATPAADWVSPDRLTQALFALHRSGDG